MTAPRAVTGWATSNDKAALLAAVRPRHRGRAWVFTASLSAALVLGLGLMSNAVAQKTGEKPNPPSPEIKIVKSQPRWKHRLYGWIYLGDEHGDLNDVEARCTASVTIKDPGGIGEIKKDFALHSFITTHKTDKDHGQLKGAEGSSLFPDPDRTNPNTGKIVELGSEDALFRHDLLCHGENQFTADLTKVTCEFGGREGHKEFSKKTTITPAAAKKPARPNEFVPAGQQKTSRVVNGEKYDCVEEKYVAEQVTTALQQAAAPNTPGDASETMTLLKCTRKCPDRVKKPGDEPKEPQKPQGKPQGLLVPVDEQSDRQQRSQPEKLETVVPAAALQPGADVAKNDVLLVDAGSQKEIPDGKLVIIPDDPKKPVSPPIPVKADGKASLPPIDRNDRVVVLTEDHRKLEFTGNDLPPESGARLPLPPKPLRMVVHDTSCPDVSDRLVEEGLGDLYGAYLEASASAPWKRSEVTLGEKDVERTDCVVEITSYASKRPNRRVVPKDGPHVTKDHKLIEADQPREIQGPPPGEPYATSSGSWGQPYGDQWYLKAVHWLKNDGTSVLPDKANLTTVAVIDTGVDFTHPELKGANWINPDPGAQGDRYGWNFVDETADIRDFAGHGTIIAGIIAASSAERFGIAGINPWARIMALKAMELDGSGGSINLARAIVYAANHGARVINVSVGGRTLTKIEQDAIDYAAQRDALVVVAAGNDGIETKNFSPAGLKNVLAVAAVGPDLQRQTFSNWGATIGIAAPGVDILSLRARQTDLLQMTRREYKPGTAVVGEQFYRATGSSFAAPIVSGAASLLFSVKPDLTAAQVKRMLLQSARDLEGIGINQFSGYGLLDIEAALGADPNAYTEAAISGISVVRQNGRQAVRVSGSADADRLQEAQVLIGAGNTPTKWKPVAKPLTKPIVNGTLAEIATSAFAGSKEWVIRVIVTGRNGLKREARFKLTLG